MDDARESPSLSLFSSLSNMGANVDFSDPFFKISKRDDLTLYKKSVPLSEENIKKYDLVVVLTNHSDFNLDLIRDSANNC